MHCAGDKDGEQHRGTQAETHFELAMEMQDSLSYLLPAVADSKENAETAKAIPRED